LEPRIITEATDIYGLSALIRSVRENPRFLSVAETMINARQRGNSALAFSPSANGFLAAAPFGALAVVSPCRDSD